MSGAHQTARVLKQVGDIVVHRQRQHGDAIQTHNRVAKFWSAYLDRPLTATDAAVMLNLLKVSRIAESVSPPQDTFDDMVGYAAIAAACAKATRPESDSFNGSNLEDCPPDH